ncbi:histidine kinase dimerization/phospho-acceptor domain-containing protein [Sorangium sp. So ce296]|uniref:sensor histidine kinase n=1 Tax=Sorangium sp. So ce296 TaxID=3133296 RepID=UPI003F5EB2ED
MPSSRAMRGETIPGEEIVIHRDGGACRTFLIAAAPLRDGEGTITGAVVAGEDISPLKELERMREEWTSVIAHELRQPISAIVFKASMLAKQAQCSDSARHILASAMQLSRMISDLLDVSRLESRRLELSRAEEELPRLFSRYYRTREAKTGGAAGLGLGLYIVRGICRGPWRAGLDRERAREDDVPARAAAAVARRPSDRARW